MKLARQIPVDGPMIGGKLRVEMDGGRIFGFDIGHTSYIKGMVSVVYNGGESIEGARHAHKLLGEIIRLHDNPGELEELEAKIQRERAERRERNEQKKAEALEIAKKEMADQKKQDAKQRKELEAEAEDLALQKRAEQIARGL